MARALAALSLLAWATAIGAAEAALDHDGLIPRVYVSPTDEVHVVAKVAATTVEDPWQTVVRFTTALWGTYAPTGDEAPRQTAPGITDYAPVLVEPLFVQRGETLQLLELLRLVA